MGSLNSNSGLLLTQSSKILDDIRLILNSDDLNLENASARLIPAENIGYYWICQTILDYLVVCSET